MVKSRPAGAVRAPLTFIVKQDTKPYFNSSAVTGGVPEIFQLAHAPHQRWYWASAMERDEVLLIKGWDSRDDGRARFTPHGAFRLPGQDAAGRPRESIEVRTYLLFEG